MVHKIIDGIQFISLAIKLTGNDSLMKILLRDVSILYIQIIVKS